MWLVGLDAVGAQRLAALATLGHPPVRRRPRDDEVVARARRRTRRTPSRPAPPRARRRRTRRRSRCGRRGSASRRPRRRCARRRWPSTSRRPGHDVDPADRVLVGEQVVQLQVPGQQRVVRRGRQVGQLPGAGVEDRGRQPAVVEQRGVGGEPLLAHQLLVVQPALGRRGAGCAAWAGRARSAGSAPCRSRSSTASGDRTRMSCHPASSSLPRMSMTPQDPSPARAADPAERALFRGLVDDAAVFPPGLAPLPRRRGGAPGPPVASPGPTWSVRCSCPPPRPPSCWPCPRAAPLDVVLVARPGTAARRGRARPSTSSRRDATVTVVARRDRLVQPSGAGSLGWGLPVSVEVPRGPDLVPALEDVRDAHGRQEPAAGQAAHGRHRRAARPGRRPSWPRSCAPVSTWTWGSSSPVACTTPSPTPPPTVSDQHGFVNVLCATRWALAHAAEVPRAGGPAGATGPGATGRHPHPHERGRRQRRPRLLHGVRLLRGHRPRARPVDAGPDQRRPHEHQLARPAAQTTPSAWTALPYGVFSTDDPDLRRVGVRIGDQVLDARPSPPSTPAWSPAPAGPSRA